MSIWLAISTARSGWSSHRGGQRMGADVRRSEASPRVVAVRAKTLGQVLGIGEIPARCGWVALSGRGDCGDQQQGPPHRDQRRVSVAHRGQMVGTDGSNLLGVSAFATSLQSAGQLVGGRPLQDRRGAEGPRRSRPVGGEAGGRRVVELGRELGGQHEGPSLRRENALPALRVLGEDRAVGRGTDERGESVGNMLVLASLIDAVCRGDALLERSQRGRIVWSRS